MPGMSCSTRGKALWPVVFDYEDMSPGNWLGWDFVKMETELKVRAYPSVFSGPLTADRGAAEGGELFVESVFRHESETARETERRHRNNAWPIVTDAASPPERLGRLVLEVRHRAALHLGVNVGRANRWLEEYYFLLAYYGVYAGRFDNLPDKERVALLVSAGVAAARLTWPRVHDAGPTAGRTADEVLAVPCPGYQSYLDVARQWLHSGERERKGQAVRLLEGLRRRYPNAPQVAQTLVLALIETGHPEEAEKVLREAEKEFASPDEESLSRFGRLFRDKGDEYGGPPDGPPNTELALWQYERALEKYQEAARVRNGHFPLICVAELHLILASWDPARRPARFEQAQAVARDLLARRPWPAFLPDDNVWHLATEAQACWLLGDPHRARALYREAVEQGNCQPFHVASMRRGAERTLRAFQRMGRLGVSAPLENLDEIFCRTDSPPPAAGGASCPS
jgi:tetratricopeptide (TPR) repeat protein